MTNLINKIKLAWKGRAIASQLFKLKSKGRDPLFWASLIANAASALAVLKGSVPHEYGPWLIVANSLLTAGYNYSRGLAKSQADGLKPFSKSSEVWLGLATMANNALINMQTGGISTPYLATGSVVLAHAIAAGRDLANMEPTEVAAAGVVVAPGTVEPVANVANVKPPVETQ